MDKVPSGRTSLVIGALFTVAAVGIVGLLLAGQPLSGLRQALNTSPVVPIGLEVVDREGGRLDPGGSRYVPAGTTQAPPGAPPPPKAQPKPGQIDVKLFRRPPALSLDFEDGEKFLAWLDKDDAAKKFLATPAVQGIFFDLMRTLKVRAEDLERSGFTGVTVETLAREAVKAGGSIHYDLYEGSRGFSFKFRRSEAPLLGRFLPVVLPALSRRVYEVEHLKAPIEELTLGSQTVFVTEDNGEVFVSNGLKALLNLLDFRPPPRPAGKESVLLTVRSEIFLKNLLPLLTGRDNWDARFAFAPSPGAEPELRLGLDPAAVFAHLRDKISPGIYAAVPQDVFGVFAASFALSPDMTPEKWNELATNGIPPATGAAGGEGGVAFIWDINSKGADSATAVGVAVSMPDAASASMKLENYFDTESVFTGECGGGTVWLASTDEVLFTRMSEACERQSKSFLNWFEKKAFDAVEPSPQLLLALHPSVGLDEAQSLGLELRAAQGGTDTSGTSPEWKKSYDEAVARATARAKEDFNRLPGLLFLGRAGAEGGELKGIIRWSGQS